MEVDSGGLNGSEQVKAMWWQLEGVTLKVIVFKEAARVKAEKYEKLLDTTEYVRTP